MTRHVVSMRYDSQSSGRLKQYVVHPYRLVYAQNSLYLQAFVPAYNELRTFLVDRIQRLVVEEETFNPIAELGSDPFSRSMGAFSGPAVKVRLRFAPSIASFINERTWHDSQQLKDRQDGSLSMTLEVSDDYALRQWILGFGRFVRVVAPPSLVEWVVQELDRAKEQYESGAFARVLDSDAQPALPFLFSNIATA
jgi:predicted DNA-binding transcriptional regulator YafY